MNRLMIKSLEEIRIMTEGGKILGMIKGQLADSACVGTSTLEIDRLAQRLISKSGGEASFKMVQGYNHATCISINEEVVHGIPTDRKIRPGDLVSIDVGLFYKGFHTDTSVSIQVGKPSKNVQKFLEVGKSGLELAISCAKPGNRVADISAAMQKTVEKAGYSVVRALTGHGVGRHLHEEPAIPCFVVGKYRNSPILTKGMVIAIEIMYNEGVPEVVYKNSDGWTLASADGKMSGLFEETVAITKDGPVVLTRTIDE